MRSFHPSLTEKFTKSCRQVALAYARPEFEEKGRMHEEMFAKGMGQCKNTLGGGIYKKNIGADAKFNSSYPKAMTAWCRKRHASCWLRLPRMKKPRKR